VSGSIWQGYVPSPYNSDEGLIKIDHRDQRAHRLQRQLLPDDGAPSCDAGSGKPAVASQNFNWRQHNVNLSDTWVIVAKSHQPGLVLVQLHNFGGA
jgi:hypothetical protein